MQDPLLCRSTIRTLWANPQALCWRVPTPALESLLPTYLRCLLRDDKSIRPSWSSLSQEDLPVHPGASSILCLLWAQSRWVNNLLHPALCPNISYSLPLLFTRICSKAGGSKDEKMLFAKVFLEETVTERWTKGPISPMLLVLWNIFLSLKKWNN